MVISGIIKKSKERIGLVKDVAEFKRIQESLAMLKILALGRKDLDAGQVEPTGEAFTCIRERIRLRRQP